jgi:hypothetical protein
VAECLHPLLEHRKYCRLRSTEKGKHGGGGDGKGAVLKHLRTKGSRAVSASENRQNIRQCRNPITGAEVEG